VLELATIRRLGSGGDRHLDVGALLDAALYYGKVHLLLDDWQLGKLVRSAGAEGVVRMLESPAFDATLLLQFMTVAEASQGMRRLYFPAASHIHFGSRQKPSSDQLEVLLQHLNIPDGGMNTSQSEGRRILELSKTTTFEDFLGQEYQTNEIWRSLAVNDDVIRDAVLVAAIELNLPVNVECLRATKFRIENEYCEIAPGGRAISAWSSSLLSDIVAPSGDRRLSWSDILNVIETYRTDVILADILGGGFYS